MTVLKVGELLAREQGTRLKEKLKARVPAEAETFEPVSELTGNLELMRIDNGIHALVRDAAITVRLTCSRCGQPFEHEIHIVEAQRVFYMHRPESADPNEEILKVNMKDKTIDLTNMIREEILLHFPLFPVCSKGCKGLCPICGANLNKKTCDCPQRQEKPNKPLAILKNLK